MSEEEGRDRFEIPKEMRSMAEAGFDQARQTFERFLASAHQTAGAIEERGATVRAGPGTSAPRRLCRKEPADLAGLCAGAEGQGPGI